MTDAAAGWRLRVFESVGSTSDLCRSLAIAGEPEGLAMLARRQTAGRGSRGREWLSEPGNLAVSLLLRPSDRARDAGHWALLAGLAVAETLADPHIRLKWPNDVLLRGAKLGGILIDTATNDAAGLDWLVIGIGLNLAAAPEIGDRRTASLDQPRPPEDVARAIMARIDHWRRIRLLEGWAPIRTAWLQHALPLGEPMSLRRATGTVSGQFAGLGEDGSLMLQTAGRVHLFSSGEIWLPQETKEPPEC